MKREELYKKCFNLWGLEKQLYQLGEEGTELDLAVHHVLRGKADLDDLASEIADVNIMVQEFYWYYPALRNLVKQAEVLKLNRLEEKVRKSLEK